MGLFIRSLLLLVVLLNLPSESDTCMQEILEWARDHPIPEHCFQCKFSWCPRALGWLEDYERPTVVCAQQNWPLNMYMIEYDKYYNNAKTDCAKRVIQDELNYLNEDMHEFIPWAVKKGFSALVYGTADRFHQSVHRLRNISLRYQGEFNRGFIGQEKDYSSYEINYAYRVPCCLGIGPYGED